MATVNKHEKKCISFEDRSNVYNKEFERVRIITISKYTFENGKMLQDVKSTHAVTESCIYIKHFVEDADCPHTLHNTSTGVDIFFSLIFSYFCFFVAACREKNIMLHTTIWYGHGGSTVCNPTALRAINKPAERRFTALFRHHLLACFTLPFTLPCVFLSPRGKIMSLM